MTIESAINKVAKRVIDNTGDIEQTNRQRRNSFVDIYGTEYVRQGDGGAPARFRISVSPDMVYLERFEFKLIVEPFVTTVASNGIQSTEVTVNDTSLTVNDASSSADKSTITPNPHRHTTQGHSHSVVSGIAFTHTTSKNFGIKVEGIDITPYLMAQGTWVNGEGIFPSEGILDNYDLLEVASDMMAEGRESDVEKLLSPGYKVVEISSDSPFQVILVLYLKYSNTNR